MKLPIINIQIRYEQDIVYVRQRARLIAEMLGFSRTDQIRISTAVSEIARNTYQYGGGGRAEFVVQGDNLPQIFAIFFRDQGPGIADAEKILQGNFSSRTGLKCGLVGARQLMDYFHLETGSGKGTSVFLGKTIPFDKGLITSRLILQLIDALEQSAKQEPLEEIRLQNQELMQALTELRKKQEDLARINTELEDTNRGVVALYHELDEKAAQLTQANNLRASFLSHMSHEFRTPLNSIVTLSAILLNKMDGDLTLEQEKQVNFIHKAADELSGMVSDLLDLAKIDAGKLTLERKEVSIVNLFSSLRGMFKPMLDGKTLGLFFAEPEGLPLLYTDEGKLAQILRNFISNALKFTEAGEIRVSARLSKSKRSVIFAVADTGIGIAEEDQSRIFDPYTQLDNAPKTAFRGTGLGLSICKKLGNLLGGTVSVKSSLGKGSTFYAFIPVRSPDSARTPLVPAENLNFTRPYPVLVIDPDQATHALYNEYLGHTDYYMMSARSIKAGREFLMQIKPLAIILDVLFPEEDSWSFLLELKTDPATRHIPVIIASMLPEQNRALSLDMEDYCSKPLSRQWLLNKLRTLRQRVPVKTILIVDDQEVDRYILKGLLADEKYRILETASGLEALQLAEARQPDVIFMDLIRSEICGLEVLHKLKENAATRHIPVIINTSKILDPAERQALNAKVVAILSKNTDSGAILIKNIQATLEKAMQALDKR
ncbi:Hybrid histidine kinase [Candidatus Methylobacter favarea]|uniref:histidine kinase n=1 Tax=Candidatus Methylobacter favarea TaxID=2707345 RepID=A0A8S0XL13_9GAMM|nr:ATP-binding protein [Candidatus Methylobacter favarea]CAA9892472.1 Hybrid histidine kinase [Candidatus Methylobacter favarea]